MQSCALLVVEFVAAVEVFVGVDFFEFEDSALGQLRGLVDGDPPLVYDCFECVHAAHIVTLQVEARQRSQPVVNNSAASVGHNLADLALGDHGVDETHYSLLITLVHLFDVEEPRPELEIARGLR